MAGQDRKTERKSAGAVAGFIHLLTVKPLLSVMLLFILTMIFVVMDVYRLQNDIVRTQALENARLFTRAIEEFRTLYTSEVVQRVGKIPIMRVSHEYQDDPHAIPLPATMSMLLGEHISIEGAETRLASPYPFPWRQDSGGLRDLFEEEAWGALMDRPDQPFYRFETHDDLPVLRYAVADLMREACVDCHNTHPQTPRKGWQAGDLRGILEITVPLTLSLKLARENLIRTGIMMVGITGLVAVLLALVLSRLKATAMEARKFADSTEQANVSLKQEVVRRKRAEEVLSRRVDELDRSNRELESFAYVASHDLQEPLRKILAFGSRLEKKSGDMMEPDARDYLDRMLKASSRMQQLIEDLLAFSRVSSRKTKRSEVDLSRLMDDILEDMETSIAENQATVTHLGLPVIAASPVHMRQLFQNLISNGIKFRHPDRAPEVTISAVVKDTDGPDACCILQFRDNGIGFDPQYTDKIFGIFQRLHGRGAYPGTGIGLALCRKIVENHGGMIDASGEPGKGATFTVTLPLRGQATEEEEDEQ